jgi:hypothetical protein
MSAVSLQPSVFIAIFFSVFPGQKLVYDATGTVFSAFWRSLACFSNGSCR